MASCPGLCVCTPTTVLEPTSFSSSFNHLLGWVSGGAHRCTASFAERICTLHSRLIDSAEGTLSSAWWRGPHVRAPRRHGGHEAVDVVGPVAPSGRGGGRGGQRSVHRSAKMASRSRSGVFVYTVAPRALRREPRRVARAPQPPWRAGGAPSVAASRLVGKTGSARVVPPLAWRLRRGVNPHKAPKSLV